MLSRPGIVECLRAHTSASASPGASLRPLVGQAVGASHLQLLGPAGLPHAGAGGAQQHRLVRRGEDPHDLRAHQAPQRMAVRVATGIATLTAGIGHLATGNDNSAERQAETGELARLSGALAFRRRGALQQSLEASEPPARANVHDLFAFWLCWANRRRTPASHWPVTQEIR